MKLLLLVLVLISSALSAAPIPNSFEISPDKAKELATNVQWLRIMHYAKKTFGGYESQISDPKYFFASDGSTNPESELTASVRAFLDSKEEGDKNPQCIYPARYRWLKERLALDDFRSPPKFCPKLQHFKEHADAHSVTLIFSSYYLNNPSSAFGHSMLRLNRGTSAKSGKRYELLDYGINYAADATTDNPILYSVYGLLGFFQGKFTRIPYYYKVREYNDFESRDLWEYELNLTQNQVDMLVDHIWELGSTYFTYYYITQNCSYHVLTALEVVMPDVNLSSELPYVVVPIDTVKIVNRVPGLVRHVTFRPSLRSQFNKRVSLLSSNEQRAVVRLAENENLSAISDDLTPKEKAAVLDAAMDHFDLKNFRTLLNDPNDPIGEWKEKLLVARSQLGVMSENLVVERPDERRPDAGHDVARVGLESGYSRELGTYGALNARLALHDLVDPTLGYPQNAQLEFLNTQLRFNERERTFWVENFNLIQVTSITPIDSFSQPLSWKFRVGSNVVRDENCDHCVSGGAEMGGGIGFQPIRSVPLVGYLLSDIDVAMTPKFVRSFFKFGIGPILGVRYAFSDRLVFAAEGVYRFQWPSVNQAQHYLTYSGELRWGVTNNFALNVKSRKYPDAWENSVGAFYYF